MQANERTFLLGGQQTRGLSTLFAVVCILDVFGVFPVVTLPKSVIECGFLGILLITLICSLQIYTANLLGKCWIMAEEIFPAIQRKNRYPYAALAEVTFGTRLANCVTFLLDLTIFSGGIPNLIVASQNLQLLGWRISEEKLDVSFCYWIIIVGTILCPVLWLGSPKDMKCLCSLSAIIVVSVFILTSGCLIFSTPTVIPESEEIGQLFPWQAMLKAYGIIAFQFDIHPTILTIQVDMEDKTKLLKALICGFIASLSMFGITATIAFLKYGSLIGSSILETLPSTIPLHLAAVLVAVQLCLTSAISNNALYQQMEECMNISRDFNAKRCILRTSLTVLSVVIAESVPKFDLVMSVIGGTLTGPLVFILPPVIYLKMLSLRLKHEETLAMTSFTNIVLIREPGDVSEDAERRFKDTTEMYENPCWTNVLEKLFCVIIVVCSIFATLGTTYINLTSAALSYTNLTKPCIYNLTLTLVYL